MSVHRLPLGEYLDAAVSAAHAGAAVLQAYAGKRNELVIDTKTRNDLVSQADREAEQAVLQILLERTPELGIVAEESGRKPNRGVQATWYIDPLDGTTNFLHGIPHYAVSIALVAHAGSCVNTDTPLEHDTPVLGVVYDPCREELFTAAYEVGAWLNGHRIQCSPTQNFSDALLATGLPFRDFSFESSYMPTLDHAMHHTRGVRRLGAAALDLAWVACGRYDGYWEMGLAPWDVAAGTVIVREAGGVADDIRHTHPWPIDGYVYAGNPHVAEALNAMIQPHIATLST